MLQQVHINAECIKIFIIVQAAGERDLSGTAGERDVATPRMYPVCGVAFL